MLHACCLFFTSWIFGVCYGFVLLSTVAGADVLEPGGSWNYDMHTTVLLNEMEGREENKDVGFLISGNVLVQVLWANSDQERIIKFELTPRLEIKSRKAPSPDGFVYHTSELDSLADKRFYVHWNKGKIEKVFLPKNERLSISNLKKGIASLFQFQLTDSEDIDEIDSSGYCKSSYSFTTHNTLLKTKSHCHSPDLPFHVNPDLLLGNSAKSSRTVTYEINSSSNKIVRISSYETHLVRLNVKEDTGSNLEVHQSLLFKEETTGRVVKGSYGHEVMATIQENDAIELTQESLLTEKEPSLNEEIIKKLEIALEDCRDNLRGNLFGKVSPAKSFIKLVASTRESGRDDVAKVLRAKKNKNILLQLYDVMGYAQTKESHEAVMKTVQLENEDFEERIERYFWALSLSSRPNAHIIIDLIDKYVKLNGLTSKIKETLLQTVASMAHRLSKLPDNKKTKKSISLVLETLTYGFENAKNEERLIFLRAFRNLKTPSSLPFLLEVVRKGSSKEGSLAWKAIRSLDGIYWDAHVEKVAWNTFLQLDKIHDSSSRTIASDILLETTRGEKLKIIINFLVENREKNFEIKQYLWQKIKMMSENDMEFEKKVVEIIRENPRINNYDVLSPKGLSTALGRKFLENESINGTLVTIQEMNGGIVKRGVVDILLEKNGTKQEIFGLGIFSGGLSSFISSDSESDADDETATAGIELTILGTQIRPFVFFQGQGELMGHVWSGTASEMTPAIQILAMLYDHWEFIRLSPGFIAEIDIKGAVSFDLSGKIEISLWNRNAASVVKKSAGVVVEGYTKVNADFVKSQTEFVVSIEPKLNLNTDLDFSSDPKLCMKLSQPEFIMRHNTFKIERIPGSKHRLRKVTYRKRLVPGRTYALNKKNDEMCNLINGSS